TADLEYSGQPGALNEHCADVFGALTEQHAAGQNAEDADWLIGAGIFTAEVSGRALRSMIEPGTAYDDDVLGKDPQPSHKIGRASCRERGRRSMIEEALKAKEIYRRTESDERWKK